MPLWPSPELFYKKVDHTGRCSWKGITAGIKQEEYCQFFLFNTGGLYHPERH